MANKFVRGISALPSHNPFKGVLETKHSHHSKTLRTHVGTKLLNTFRVFNGNVETTKLTKLGARVVAARAKKNNALTQSLTAEFIALSNNMHYGLIDIPVVIAAYALIAVLMIPLLIAIIPLALFGASIYGLLRLAKWMIAQKNAWSLLGVLIIIPTVAAAVAVVTVAAVALLAVQVVNVSWSIVKGITSAVLTLLSSPIVFAVELFSLRAAKREINSFNNLNVKTVQQINHPNLVANADLAHAENMKSVMRNREKLTQVVMVAGIANAASNIARLDHIAIYEKDKAPNIDPPAFILTVAEIQQKPEAFNALLKLNMFNMLRENENPTRLRPVNAAHNAENPGAEPDLMPSNYLFSWLHHKGVGVEQRFIEQDLARHDDSRQPLLYGR
jgi:hypothetical protein